MKIVSFTLVIMKQALCTVKTTDIYSNYTEVFHQTEDYCWRTQILNRHSATDCNHNTGAEYNS
jgi:hypothetical protein